jgi:hypothetical protein
MISLKEYLGNNDLTENLYLTKNISFHWSNWDQACLAQRDHFKKYNNNYYIIELNHSLQELKNQTIWLCNKVETKRTDLYALYESYTDSRLRLTWLDRKDEILFSNNSEQGPYYTITSMKWFDKDIYAKFVMRKILIEHYTLRSFRLNTALPITFKFDNDVNYYNEKVSVHQISEAGIILKVTDKNFVNKIKNSQMLECLIPVKTFKITEKLNLQDTLKNLDNDNLLQKENYKSYFLDAKVLKSYGNLSNTKRSGDNEFYLFARYSDFIPFGHNLLLDNAFIPLVLKTKNYFLDELDQVDPKKLAA